VRSFGQKNNPSALSSGEGERITCRIREHRKGKKENGLKARGREKQEAFHPNETGVVPQQLQKARKDYGAEKKTLRTSEGKGSKRGTKRDRL